MGTPAGRWVLLATISGSGMAMLDATVVNIALPSIAGDLDTDFRTLQWIVNAYTLTLAALILLAGALGDHFGRRRIFLLGVVWFAVASLLCGLAPTAEFLVAARALQGIGGALLTPGSLAIISSTFVASDRAKAVGAWSGLGGMAAAIGPFVGGWLVTLDPATVLNSADPRYAGTASGVNNAIARSGGLLAVAVIPVAAGLGGTDYTDPLSFSPGFGTAMLISAALLALGALMAVALLREPRPALIPGVPERLPLERCTHCGVAGPQLHPANRS
jgi:MFS family permease